MDLYSLLNEVSGMTKSPLVSLPPEKMPSRSQWKMRQRPVLPRVASHVEVLAARVPVAERSTVSAMYLTISGTSRLAQIQAVLAAEGAWLRAWVSCQTSV